jgi:6-phosphogluconolactonase
VLVRRLLGLLGLLSFGVASDAADTVGLYVGTYTGGTSQSKGIYRLDLDFGTGALSSPKVVAETTSPSFLAIDPTRRFLYAVNEVDSVDGKKGGGVSAFAINAKDGGLTALNQQSSGGAGPCHIVVDKAGKNALVANYGGGSVAVLPIAADGRLGSASSFVQHTGSSVDKRRQNEPHAHSVNLDAANKYAFVADLGLDKVLVYRFDPDKGTITANDPPAATVAPGAGPRHFAFSPTGKFAYAIGELDSTVTAWTYDPTRGTLSTIQTISTLPTSFTGTNHPADVQVDPTGKFLYGSNRGHNSIVAYTIDPATGKLTYVANQGEGIKNPRNFAIDPSSTFLLVGNQDLDSIVVFRIDPATGALRPTGHSVKVPKPVCLKFLAPAR